MPPPPVLGQEAPPAESLMEVPAGLQQFADQFTRGFREVLASTVRDLQAPMTDEKRKLEAALESIARISIEVEAARSAAAEAAGKIDSLAKSLQELAARTGKLEDASNIVSAAAHALQDAQQAMDKRLEVQAGVLRGLNSAVQAREDRLDRLVSTLQALQGGFSEHPGRRSLPENL